MEFGIGDMHKLRKQAYEVFNPLMLKNSLSSGFFLVWW